MKRIIIIICMLLCLVGCRTPQETTIIHHETVTHVKDSVAIRDSVVLIPQESYTNLTWTYETLHLETSLAEADCWVDSLWLRGNIKNKKNAQFQIIEVDKWHTKDSIVEKEVPVPVNVYVEKPLNNKLLTWAILTSTGLLAALCWIFRKWIIKLISLFA